MKPKRGLLYEAVTKLHSHTTRNSDWPQGNDPRGEDEFQASLGCGIRQQAIASAQVNEARLRGIS